MALAGNKISGGNPKESRAMYDYYATNPKAVKMLLNEINLFENCNTILEPCVGAGHIANAVKEFYDGILTITAVDIVGRGFPNTIISDFLNWESNVKYDGIITNPPYSLAKEFVEKGMSFLEDKKYMASLSLYRMQEH